MTAGATPAGAASHDALDWHAIDWRRVHQTVRRLQIRIVKAIQEGRWGKVRALQHLLTHSFSAKALAVRRVTENQGKRTPGVDRVTWRTPEQKATAIGTLRQRGYRPQPLRRVYVAKSNGKLRGLGIPTMQDRAMQALYLQALDPIAETLADPNSYGFRTHRAPADAIEQCFIALAKKASPPWVLEGDIRACFDELSHDWLLAHIPMDKAILRKWLKAGYVEAHVPKLATTSFTLVRNEADLIRHAPPRRAATAVCEVEQAPDVLAAWCDIPPRSPGASAGSAFPVGRRSVWDRRPPRGSL